MNREMGLAAVIAAALAMAGCGGGGGGTSPTPTTTTLSATQQHFEATTRSDSYVTFDWYLPSTNVAPASGTNYFIYTVNSAQSSPTAGPVQDADTAVNLAATLAMPDLARLGVSRILKGGVIHANNATSRQMWSYVGDAVELDTYATDGTLTTQSVYDDWSAPIPLTGTIASSTVLNRFLGFTRLNTPANLDFTKTWLAGSSYFTRKGYAKTDTLFLFDWSSTPTTGTSPTPWNGPETTIEGLFADPLFVNGISVDHVAYKIGSGQIGTIEGARVWVADTPRPASAAPTTSYVAFVQLNGKIYNAQLRKAGARYNVVDGVDSAVVDDYNIRLNLTAAQSIQQAVEF